MTCAQFGQDAPYAGPVTTPEPPPEHHLALGTPAPVAPLAVPTQKIIAAGIGLWLVALVVTLVVPALHTGDRSWWPWTCLSGALLGVFAMWFVRRGRGNAVGA